ncbi:MAG TPA: gamma-glutamyltransferase [Acidocella sp.]|nr:gamma-glutamyltransferase [Acidocella sp.]
MQHSPLLRAAPLLAAITLPLTGCGFGNSLLGGDSAAASLGQAAAAPTVFGYAVADEPQAALVARQILNDGGNAADAAAAAGFAMAVTLPSRAGLGGGGSCIIKMPGAQGNPQPAVTLIFPPASNSAQGDRPAAAPTMARGLLALQARYGTLPYASVIAPAERLAAGGVPVSPALAADLQVVGNALLADPAARAVFAAPGGGVLPAGANLVQPDLATTLEILRTQDVEGLYKGSFGTQFLAAANQAGGGLTQADLDAALPHYGKPNVSKISGVMVATIPTAAPSANLPASAAFAALDKNGGVVACATTMNNLFGTGRIAPGTGILLAASPRAVPAPLLAAGIAYSGGEFRAAVTGTGQEGAAVAVADGLANALAKTPAAQVPEPGRANIIACPGGVPGGEASCTASADPRGQGLAIGGR